MLVAISIPIFTAQLEKSKEATDLANIRAAYAEVMTKAVEEPNKDYEQDVTLKQAQTGWTNTTKQQTAGWGTSFDFPADLVTGQGTSDVPRGP